MYRIKYYFVKVLQKLNLLSRFNFYLTKTINEERIKVPLTNGIGLSNFILTSNWLDSLIRQFVNENNKTFIDVGVNIGQSLLRLKTLKPATEYLGFEPNSTCTSYAQQLVKLNRFNNCTLQNCALSQKTQIMELEKTFVDDSRASVIASLRPAYFSSKESILALNYDSFYLERKISFIKIDVEGGELEVLQGMKESIMKHEPLITCEVLDYHDESTFEFAQTRATQLTELLRSVNYAIIHLETSKSNHNIVAFKKIDSILLKQWTPLSSYSNDYLFFPQNMENEVLTKLKNSIIISL